MAKNKNLAEIIATFLNFRNHKFWVFADWEKEMGREG
jgi:hypothetical protein